MAAGCPQAPSGRTRPQAGALADLCLLGFMDLSFRFTPLKYVEFDQLNRNHVFNRITSTLDFNQVPLLEMTRLIRRTCLVQTQLAACSLQEPQPGEVLSPWLLLMGVKSVLWKVSRQCGIRTDLRATAENLPTVLKKVILLGEVKPWWRLERAVRSSQVLATAL